jgi:hypothetical protein
MKTLMRVMVRTVGGRFGLVAEVVLALVLFGTTSS